MPRSPERARGMIQAKRRRGHGTQTSSEGFTVESSMYHTTFCTMYKDSGSPEKSSGIALFYLYDKRHIYENVYSIFSAWHRVRPVGPEPRRLLQYAASRSRTSSVLAPKTSFVRSHSSQSDCMAGKGCKEVPHAKERLRESTHIVEGGIALSRLAAWQPDGRPPPLLPKTSEWLSPSPPHQWLER